MAVSSVASPVPSVETPADEHQGHLRLDYRFSEANSLAMRYNMVRWQKDTETGGLNLPGTGYIWDNNVDTVHGMFTTVGRRGSSTRCGPGTSRYTDSRAAKLDAVSINRTNYAISGGNDQGTWGVIPETTYDLSDTVSMWMGQPHDEGRRVDHLRRDQAALPAAAERRLPVPRRPGAVPRIRSSSTSRSPWFLRRG